MGVIEAGREAVTEIQGEHQDLAGDARNKAISGIMANLSGVLKEPEYSGDVETALIHHVGERAFTDESFTDPYTNLVDKIEDYIATHPDHEIGTDIPVLFVFEAGYDSSNSALIKVDPDDLTFCSVKSREEDVKMHAIMEKTASVNHSYLHIMGNTTVVLGDITDEHDSDGKSVGLENYGGVLLRESHVAEGGHGQRMPNAYVFSDSETDHLEDDAIVLVGWEEIGAALAEGIQNAGGGVEIGFQFSKILSVQKFLEASGDLGTVKERVPVLGRVISQATALKNGLGRLANSSLVQ